jgi:lysophospholipase L1-like esterase
VTIISAAPGFHPYQQERTGRLKVQSIQHMLFGIPEHVKNFNRISRDFAERKGWNYLDFHRACVASGDLKQLFIPDDGVHMTLAGHQLLAALLLEHLQKQPE